MRRAALADLPAFSAIYGIHPWHVEHMTFAELREYRTQLARWAQR